MARTSKAQILKMEICGHWQGFQHDNSYAGRWRMINKDGHTYETWRETCPECGAWIQVERIDGKII